MKQLTSNEVRRMFLDFFKEKDHMIYPSQSLVPVNDPTLLWVNSGIATLKKYFDGTEVPENSRIANSQKSLRTNDIENVGKTARHHTFFEMLGNFSIGDYFKEKAIKWAWEFLTSKKWIGFDEELLYVTIYPNDDEAYEIWKSLGLSDDHIVRLEGNFWEIGEGPSGPNTEIFYDRGPAYEFDTPKEEMYVGGENERYLEIWNLVFSQYNAKKGLKREEYPELPNKNIDTGMGLERLVSVIQDVPTNYDTDMFIPIINKVETLSGKKYLKNNDQDVAFRVISDHVRTVSFAITDGALPSNEGRGYIIRRLIRRSIKFARKLGLTKPFLKDLVPIVASIMKDYYPEIQEKIEFIQSIIENEELRFHETLQGGLAILSDVIENQDIKEIDGKTAFKLYDTFGFPIELTIEYADEAGLTVDEAGFKIELEKQRERARNARTDVGSMKSQNETLMKFKKASQFCGYDSLSTKGKVIGMFNGEETLKSAKEGDKVQLILDETPFYAESGGQVADTGMIYNEQATIYVNDVLKAPNGQHLHSCIVKKGQINVKDHVILEVNEESRKYITRNHTATHLLHKALKEVVGDHVNQAGSFVSNERLRFDFTHFSGLSEEELKRVERIVNQQIFKSSKVDASEMTINEAKELGAMALFGEKYGDIVRVVSTGDFSIELCGGCHVDNTSEIGMFKIISESGIGAGTRRIEAVTSKEAYEYLETFVEKTEKIAETVKSTTMEVVNKTAALVKENKALQKELESLQAKMSSLKTSELINQVEEINGYNVLRAKLKNVDMNNLRDMVDGFKQKLGSAIIVLANINDSKINFIVGVTDDYIKDGIAAGSLIKEVAKICGGGGGGRKDLAQAGGKNPGNVDKALKHVETYLENK